MTAASALRNFAILDCAVDDALYAHVARLEPAAARCLFLGNLHPKVRAASPHLVELAPGDALTRQWRETGWGKAWGLVIQSTQDLHRVWRRMRHFTQARLPHGEGPVLFRFWDPRVFRIYAPLIEPTDAPAWFEGVDAYVCEAEDAKGALRFTRTASGVSGAVVSIPI